MTQQPAWKRKLSFLSPSSTPFEVCGEEINFYPISGRLLFKLKTIARPLAQGLTVLFDGKIAEQGSVQRDVTYPAVTEPDGTVIPEQKGTETQIMPISPELYEARTRQKEIAINNLVDALSKEENTLLIAEIIFDSCRDVFPRKPEKQDLEEFLEEHTDFSNLGQFLMGVAQANVKVFGPLGERVSKAFEEKLGGPNVPQESEPAASSPAGKTTSSVPTPSPTPPASPTMAPPIQPPVTPAPQAG